MICHLITEITNNDGNEKDDDETPSLVDLPLIFPFMHNRKAFKYLSSTFWLFLSLCLLGHESLELQN